MDGPSSHPVGHGLARALCWTLSCLSWPHTLHSRPHPFSGSETTAGQIEDLSEGPASITATGEMRFSGDGEADYNWSIDLPVLPSSKADPTFKTER